MEGHPWLKTISAIFTNLSAGFFYIAFAILSSGNLADQKISSSILFNVLSGLMAFLIAGSLEKIIIQKEQ